MKLEELARQSSDAARASVIRLDPPPIGEGRPGRSWAPILVAVGVSVALVAGLAVLLDGRPDGGLDPAEQPAPRVVDVPRLGLPDLEGWQITHAAELDTPASGTEQRPRITYYGTDGATDPFADGDLLVATIVGSDSINDSAGGESVPVRGTTGDLGSGQTAGLPDGAISLSWTEPSPTGETLEIMLISRSFDRTELAQIAEALTVDPATSAVTPDATLGLDRLVTTTGTPFDPFATDGDGYLIAYESPGSTGEETGDYLVVSTSRGDLDDEIAGLRWWTSAPTSVTVGGRPGSLVELLVDDEASQDAHTLTWSPVDGVVAAITHFGLGQLDLVALAESATEIDDATWAAYLQRSDDAANGADDFDTIYGQGSGSIEEHQYSWIVGEQGDSFCLQMQAGDSSTGSCRERAGITAPEGSARTIDNSFGPDIASLVIIADPSVEMIEETTGGYVISRVEADGAAWFVAIGPASTQPRFDVIVDGVVVETIEAAVEGVAEFSPALQDVTAAVELGIADMNIVAFGNDWWLGEQGPDLCLVTAGPSETADPALAAGPAETAGCSAEGDLTVFRPITFDGGEQTFVIVRDLPTCVEAVAFDAPGAVFLGGGNTVDHRYEVWTVPGAAEGWNLLATVAGSEVAIPLADVEGTIEWPAGLCNG